MTTRTMVVTSKVAVVAAVLVFSAVAFTSFIADISFTGHNVLASMLKGVVFGGLVFGVLWRFRGKTMRLW